MNPKLTPKKPHPRLPLVVWAAMDPLDAQFVPAIFSTRRGAFIYRGMDTYPIVKVRIVASDEAVGPDDTARMKLIRDVADWAWENPDATMDEADEAFAKFAGAMKVGTE